MGARPLTHKQRTFAELVAGGCSKVDAFRRAYPSDRRGKQTEWQGAKRVARQPKIIAEIERLSLLHAPHDAAAQAEHITARLLELTKSREPGVALRAIGQWAKMMEAGLLKVPLAAHASERERLVDDLMAFYEKAAVVKAQNEIALPPPAIPKSEGEFHGPVVDIESDDTALSEVVPPPVVEELPSRSLPPSFANHGTSDGRDQPEPTQQQTTTTPEYQWVNLPGHFGKARKRRVRISSRETATN
jgi:hypothetical protein